MVQDVWTKHTSSFLIIGDTLELLHFFNNGVTHKPQISSNELLS